MLSSAALLQACSAGDPSEEVRSSRNALAGPISLSLAAPNSVSVIAPTLSASNFVSIGAHAEVITSGLTVSMGNAGLNAEPDALLNETWSLGRATLRDRVHVRGTLHAATRTLFNGVAVDNFDTAPVFDPASSLDWTVTYPDVDPLPNFELAPDGSGSIAPGRYGNVRASARSTLTLSAGTYYLDQLQIEPQAIVRLDQTAGPVIIYVSSNFQPRGAFVTTNGDAPDLFVGYLGSNAVFLETPFDGAVFAPFAELVLRSVAREHRGFFAGKNVTLDANARVKYVAPFALVPAANPTPELCRTLITAPDAQARYCPDPLPERPPTRLPKPPVVPGCYFRDANGWQPTECAPVPYVLENFGSPEIPVRLTSDSFVEGGVTQRAPLVYGQLETVLPQVGTITDAFVDRMIPECPSSGSDRPNRWSIQGNTNIFTGNNGNFDAVQFVVQANGSENAICVWNIDVTNQNYNPTCVTAPQRDGGLRDFDQGNVAGSVDPTTGQLTLVAQLTWVDTGEPFQYAVVTNDQYGLGGRWFEFDGSLLGIGNCSEAQFTDTEMVSRLMVSSCPGDTEEGSSVASCPTPVLEPHVSLGNSTPTAETNNLTRFGTPTVTYLNDSLASTSWNSSTTGACLGSSHGYVRDHANDLGGIPSNLGGQAFWESPDLFLVPAGSPVDVNAKASETLITPGGTFDVYVRVRNDVGCSDVTSAKAMVYLADPSALSTQWQPITGAMYLGDAANPGGDTVAAGGAELIGPFTFTAPTVGFGNGHKCLIAAIQADGEPPVANSFDAPNSNQVAQRNVQFSACEYPLVNATVSNGTVDIALTVTPLEVTPSLSAGPQIEAVFDDPDLSWYNIWVAQPDNGTNYAVTNAAGRTTVRLGRNGITLAPVPLAAGASRTSTANLFLGLGGPTTSLALQATLRDSTGAVLVTNGGSCQITPPRNPG